MWTKQEDLAISTMLQDMAAMYGKTLSDFQLGFYMRAFRDFRAHDILKGISAVGSSASFLPKPVEIKEWIENNITGGSRKSHGEAWLRELMCYFNDRSFTICEDPCFGKAFRQTFGSMHYLGKCKADDDALVKKFLPAYNIITEATIEDALIPGSSKDREPPLRYLGDWHKCDAIARQLFPERENFPTNPDDVVKLAPVPEQKEPPQYVPKEVIAATLEQLLKEFTLAK